MATLALSVAGAAVGGALLPSGVTVLGATLSGAAIGAQIGGLAGSYVDQALFGTSGESRTVEGPRLRDLHLVSSTEGAAIPRAYGRVRLGGQVIWATDFEEEAVRTTEGGGGGKGIGGAGGQSSSSVERVEYRYYANFAVALCEGEISGLGRVWADGAELDLSQYLHRVHFGGETQSPDPLILAREGAAPAYRGLAYVVFERMPLEVFGNRLPQLSFEVHRPTDDFQQQVRGVVLIPGSGEFVYSPSAVTQTFGISGSAAQNVNTNQGGSDWQVAIGQLQEALPNARNISFVVSWFGTDLRAGHCEIRPGVEVAAKTTAPYDWRGGGVERADAHLVSLRDGRPAYGGTPSDKSVIDAVRDLKARGMSVTLTPFVLMDVPSGNGLANPYGGSEQPAYPWRGRITCDPAPGLPGSVDQTPAASAQIAAFVGTSTPAHFSVSGDTVSYAGPAEWSYRRMVLHQAHLAVAAGGVDAFVIGTEMRGVTWVRDGAASYPFVSALQTLAADVKAVLGPTTKVTYAADWTEYFGHQPTDGSGDVYFHLDPLWASPHIDAVGIDCYWPLADWRNGRAHADYVNGARSIYDLDYLAGNVTGGEGYDWYYANAADRDAQVRTPITDGSGKPWVFRYKDVRNWWSNPHYNRPGGIEAASPTAWVPESKPIWLMEIGSPAADKGANQPNVFVDPKSSENALPYYSSGGRDDLMQRRYIEALIRAFDPAHPEHAAGVNPVSSVYGEAMVDVSRMFVYCWDARPYPAFPFNLDAWGDGENWRLGHWLNGRMSGVPLAELVSALLAEADFDRGSTGRLTGFVPGYVVDRPMSVREALQPLSLAYFFDAVESGAEISFRHRGGEPAVVRFDASDLVERKPDEPLMTLTRGQETDLPSQAKISYVSGASGYAQSVVEARRLVGASGRVSRAELPIVMEADQASAIAESWLYEAWAARERAKFSVPPSRLDLEPGDVIELGEGEAARQYRVTEIADDGARSIDARSVDADVYELVTGPARAGRVADSPVSGQPQVTFLDLPLLTGSEPGGAGYVAAAQSPWPGALALYGAPEQNGFQLRGVLPAPAIVGVSLTALPRGPASRFDHATRFQVHVEGGSLASVSHLSLLGGANLAAVVGRDGAWEVLQFQFAELVADGTYELSGLLRGQGGTEAALADYGAPVAAGARFVLLDSSVVRVDLSLDEIRLPYEWRYGPANLDLADASFGSRQHAFAGIGLRPLSPVHVRGKRSAGGDLDVSWIRRTRVGGDSWETLEVPLAEEVERYEIDFLAGDGSVARTLVSDTTSVSYPASDQMADFGGLPSAVAVQVAQVSAIYGRGSAQQAVV